MNCDTGELFNKFEDGVEEALSRGLTKEQATAEVIPLNERDFDQLKGLNRAQRRQWARANKRKMPAQQ